MSITFKVSDVGEKDRNGFWYVDGFYKPELAILEAAFGEFASNRHYRTPEAFGGAERVLRMAQADGLFQAVHTAFQMHYALALAPDHIWLTIERQVAKYITENSEELRSKFVDHEGTKNIEIRRDSFVKRSRDNDWEGAFQEFGEQIGKRIKIDSKLFLNDFSTTSSVDRAASEVVLMDAMSKYFTYSMRTCCGIPEITLLGTPEDWMSLREKAHNLLSLTGLLDWEEDVASVLVKLAETAAGNVDTTWWQSFYKYRSGSGSDCITGHITNLYRATVATKTGYMIKAGERAMTTDDIVDQVSRVPFIWHYYDKEYRMEFWAGLPFATIENGVVRPVTAWAVAEAR